MDSSEWIVLPPIFWAETPVGASRRKFDLLLLRIFIIKFMMWRLSKVCDIGLGVVQALLDWRYLYNQEIRREIFHDHLGK
ncbi:unnamed protein product [Rhizophagus irregularis]|nr:unnamed protein product [Rhizophagus irregularis]CAB4417020.1 unnamed protein product [Rhizophagus irregularis]